MCRFSKDGSLFAYATNTDVVVLDASSGAQLFSFALNRASDLYISPLNSFLATWQRPENAPKGENLVVFDLRTGERATVFSQRSQSHWWPQWSDDETVCVRLGNNGVHFMDGKDLKAGIKSQLQLERVADIQLAPGSAPHKLAVFVPEKNVRVSLEGCRELSIHFLRRARLLLCAST